MPGVLGIDPGTTGAAALYSPERTVASGMRWVIADLPTVGDTRKEINARAFTDWLQRFSPDHAFLELVHAAPGWGLMSTWQFGAIFGAIKAILACSNVPVTLVPPPVWKKAAGLKGPDKEQSRRRALQLFPDQGEALARKKDQNRAEAMLIAKYGSLCLARDAQ